MFARIQTLLISLAVISSVRAAYTPSPCSENGTVAGEVCSRSLLDTIVADVTELFFARDFGMPSFSGNKTLTSRELPPRVVYSPKITSPGSTTVWVAGEMATVTWSVPRIISAGAL